MNIREVGTDSSLLGCFTISDAILHECGHWAAARMIGAKSNFIRIDGKVTDYGLGWTNGWFGYRAIAEHQEAKIALAPIALGMQLSEDDLTPLLKMTDSLIEKSIRWIDTNREKIRQEAERLYPQVYPALRNGDAEVKLS